MKKIRRRKALQLTGAGVLAAGTGGLAGILASGRAPAYAQTQTMHWLRWADFVPASDVLLKGEITALCEKDLGMKLTVETINANDIQARITAAIQSGAGPDIFMCLNNWPQLYGQSCVDVSDVAEDLGKAQGGFYDICKTVATMEDRWIGVPWCAGGGLVAYRKSWLAEAGSPNGFPTNWDDFRTVGKKLKANGHPIGQTAGHTFGDAPGWWYPYLWSWGGKEVEADGKTVALDTKETVESVKFAVTLWKETMDEGGLAWDDTSNNRAFPAASAPPTMERRSILRRRRNPTRT
jgi:ABC-type glycerol-3-phosphate transport system substrate-binding protein